LVLAGSAACSSAGTASTSSLSSGRTELLGTFRLSAGHCTAEGATGTYFRMIDPGGTVEHGKFFANPDSACPDKSFTVSLPGSDGGLVTGAYQPAAGQPFDKFGNALATRITQPGSFTAIRFAISTNAVDPQTKRHVPAPYITVANDGTLSGQVTAWSAAWNNLYFNQGSPKPDGSRPGLTSPVTGRYDGATHHFILTWASQVVGGPFNGFTGYWHLEGTFSPTA
jgi:hypothetical protein